MYGKCVYTLEIDFRDVVLRRYVFQNPARFNVMTQLRPWNDPDRKDQKRHRDRKPNVTLIYCYTNNLPQIKLRKLPTDDSGLHRSPWIKKEEFWNVDLLNYNFDDVDQLSPRTD